MVIVIIFGSGDAGFLRGGGGWSTIKFWGFGMYMPRNCKPLIGGFRGMPPPKQNFKNGAISCVLKAIFNHFHDKKSSEKIRNNFFTDPFILLLPHYFS